MLIVNLYNVALSFVFKNYQSIGACRTSVAIRLQGCGTWCSSLSNLDVTHKSYRPSWHRKVTASNVTHGTAGFETASADTESFHRQQWMGTAQVISYQIIRVYNVLDCLLDITTCGMTVRNRRWHLLKGPNNNSCTENITVASLYSWPNTNVVS